MNNSGLRVINGVNILPLDGLWHKLEGVASEDRLVTALEYAGCQFHDDEQRMVASHVIALAGIGGIPVAYENETDEEIADRIQETIHKTQEMMGSSAAFSYLNSGEKTIVDLYDSVAKLGHFSIAHTVQANVIVAGISEGAELELNLQRDLVHISKITNARTRIQNSPPIVVRDPAHAPVLKALYSHLQEVTDDLRTDNSGDTLEVVNGLFPINKATMIMISGDLSNFRKLGQLRNDSGKEQEVRMIADGLYQQLGLLWPEIIKDKE
jgi:hypothetical protein